MSTTVLTFCQGEPNSIKLQYLYVSLFQAYRVDVFQSGRSHTLFKRYSKFEELHKQLKKLILTPEFPPKKVMKFNTKVTEQRRVILEHYLQVSDGQSYQNET